MYRFGLTIGRQLPTAIAAAGAYGPAASTVHLSRSLPSKERYSTKANDLKTLVPEFSIRKMKTIFRYHDLDGNGYISQKEINLWASELGKRFPEWSEAQKKDWEALQHQIWRGVAAGQDGTEYKVTENMFIENMFVFLSSEGAEAYSRETFRGIFKLMDVDDDGKISKMEHRHFYEATKLNPNGAIVSFSAMDRDNDGMITRDEYVDCAVEFFSQFRRRHKTKQAFLWSTCEGELDDYMNVTVWTCIASIAIYVYMSCWLAAIFDYDCV